MKSDGKDLVPKGMQGVFDEITRLTDTFAEKFLNDEYAQLCRKMTAALCRKRPSPLGQARPLTWAAGIAYTVGWINFLYGKSQTPTMSPRKLAERFGVSSSTLGAKKKIIEATLNLMPFHPDYSLPSRLADNPLVWMVEVNNVVLDMRYMPRDYQEAAFRKGLIPFIPEPPKPENQIPADPSKDSKATASPVRPQPPQGDTGPAEPSLFDTLEN